MGPAFIISFVLVALAELGDKSQLLLLGFAARYRPLKVLAGAAIAILALQFASVMIGHAVGALLPGRLVAIVAGLMFIVFGILTWRSATAEEDESAAGRVSRMGPVLTVTLAVLIAELGDKTQLMTVSIAADPAAALRTLGSFGAGIEAPQSGTVGTAFGVWLGSSLGFLMADALAIGLGALLGAKLPKPTIARFSGVIFVLFGLLTLGSAFVGT